MRKFEGPERLLTPKEVAEFLGVSVSSLAYYRHVGRGPRWIKVQKHCRYRAKDIEAFLATCQSGGGPR
jgi:predicted site-specific integrase-resolvase